MSKPTFAERCLLAEQCLPDAPYRAMLKKLHAEMLEALAEQPAQQETAAWTLLLTGEHQGLVGKAGEKFVGHPEYYERVDVYTSPPAQRTPCQWQREDDEHMPDTWRSDCGVMWTFTDGGPVDNDMKHCCGCGAKLQEKNA